MLIQGSHRLFQLFFQQPLKHSKQIWLFPILADSVGRNIIDEKQRQGLYFAVSIAKVCFLCLKVTLKGETEHLFLVGSHVNIHIQFFAG